MFLHALVNKIELPQQYGTMSLHKLLKIVHSIDWQWIIILYQSKYNGQHGGRSDHRSIIPYRFEKVGRPHGYNDHISKANLHGFFSMINLEQNKQCVGGSGMPLHNALLFLLKMTRGSQ